MIIELSIFTGDWHTINSKLRGYCNKKRYVERDFGIVPARLNKDEYLIIKSSDPELIDMLLVKEILNNLEYIETKEEQEINDDSYYWMVIYPISDDEVFPNP